MSLHLDEIDENDLSCSIDKLLEMALNKGYDEDEWYEEMLEEDENGDLWWSKKLTLMVMTLMGMGKKKLRRKNSNLDDHAFESAWNSKFNNVHQQMYRHYHMIN